jgi:hypothetical protein
MMWTDYTVPGGCYRENLHNTPGNPYLSPRHHGSKFSYRAQSNGEAAETNGDAKKEDVVA